MPEPFATNPNGLPFIELQSVDSTNNYARQLITEGLAQNGMVVFAHEQKAGKGQRGRSWTSEKGANIMLSIVLKDPPLPLTDQFQLSACVSVAIQEFFSKYAGTDTRIKWPNDIYWQDRKAGGILIESVIGGEEGSGNASRLKAGGTRIPIAIGTEIQIWKWAIVGIGVNINQVSFSPELKNPVSLKQITGKSFDPIQLAKELILTIQKWYDELLQNGFEKILNLYNQQLHKKDEVVKLKKENISFAGRIDGVSRSGQLIVTHAIKEKFEFGEIEWLIQKINS